MFLLLMCLSSHSLLKLSSLVFSWGRGDFGQLGIRDSPEIAAQTNVLDLEGKNIIHVALGEYHSVFLTSRKDDET